MDIAITPRHRRYIDDKVKSGAYESPDEVIREGLRLLESEDERRQRLVRLQQEVEQGFAGPFTPWTKKDSEQVRRKISRRTQSRK
jgi:putative addiction module CopG family antidote